MSLASRFYRLGACILWEPREREFVELCLTPRPDVKGKRRGEAQEKHTHYGVHADIRSSSQRSPTLLARPRERCRSASSLPAGAPQLAGHQSWRVPKSVPPIFPFGSPFWAYTCCHYGPCWTPRLGFRFLRRTTPMSDPCQHAKWESAASCVRHGRAVSSLSIPKPKSTAQRRNSGQHTADKTPHTKNRRDSTSSGFFLRRRSHSLQPSRTALPRMLCHSFEFDPTLCARSPSENNLRQGNVRQSVAA